jgi:methylphosphotriester-DNA--protein-cysteine methyltransferase
MSSWRGRLKPFRNVAVARKRYRADAPSPDTNEENKEFDRAIAEFLLLGLDVGFSETSSFTSAFRKVTGQTPTEYCRSLA